MYASRVRDKKASKYQFSFRIKVLVLFFSILQVNLISVLLLKILYWFLLRTDNLASNIGNSLVPTRVSGNASMYNGRDCVVLCSWYLIFCAFITSTTFHDIEIKITFLVNEIPWQNVNKHEVWGGRHCSLPAATSASGANRLWCEVYARAHPWASSVHHFNPKS